MVGTHFDSMIAKEGETLVRYVHSFESSRDTTTNLKESQWAAGTNIVGIVRSQPKVSVPGELGLIDLDVIVVLTKTAVVDLDVLKWNSKYFNVTIVEEVFFRKSSQYYKATCIQRIEFLGD